MTRVQNVVRKLAKVFVASLVGVAAVAVAQIPAGTVSAVGPSSLRITDLVRDDAAEQMSIYWSASGGAPTDIYVQMCNDSVTITNITNPLVVAYSGLCTQYTGGVTGWLNDPTTQPWSSQFLYLTAQNSDGFAQTNMTFRPRMLSRAMISGNTVQYSNGCVATFTVSGLPTWATGNDTSWSISFWGDENAVSGTGGTAGLVSIVNGVATVKGFLDLGTWGPTPPADFADGVVAASIDLSNVATNVGYSSLKSANFSCSSDPALQVSRGSAPVVQVTPSAQGFTANWSVASSGSHPIKRLWLTLYSGDAFLQVTGSAPTTADIEMYCVNPLDFNDLTLGGNFNPYCQSPAAGNYEVPAAFATSGTIVSSKVLDQNYQPLQLVNGRNYWVAFTVEYYSPSGSNMSAASSLSQIGPGASPTVTAVSPTSGSTTGGTAITITGTNFTGASAVTVGSAACTNVVVVSATSITCTTPTGTAGTASVVVTSGGQSNVANTLFTYVAPPSVSPSTQTVSGTAGTAVAASTAFTPNNFTGAVSYAVTSGTLPAGLAISSSTGVISGTPSAASTASVTITATGATAGSATATVTFAIAAATTTTTTAPATTTPATTAAPVGPVNVTSSNQATLTQTPGAATAVVNGQPVTVAVETPADLPAAQVDPEDRSPAQVAALQTAADNLVSQLNQSAGGNSGLAVQDTPTGAAITGLLDKPVPVENTVLVEAGTKSTLFAALNQDGSVTEVQPGAVIEVLGDGQVGVVASGLTPGETAEFVIMSTPTLLGSYTVSANGTIKAQTSLPDGLGLGNHTLVVASPTVQASLGLKVSATPSTLPATGASSSNTMQIALFLMVGGLMVAFLRRRRHILN
jgi:LPXTG-motif cell wall-anchored protein